MKKEVNQEPQIELSIEEQRLVQSQRQANETRNTCAKEIEKVLEKHGCVLSIDRGSPIGNPKIIVALQ